MEKEVEPTFLEFGAKPHVKNSEKYLLFVFGFFVSFFFSFLFFSFLFFSFLFFSLLFFSFFLTVMRKGKAAAYGSIHEAIVIKDLAAVQEMLKDDNNKINARDTWGNTPLHVAIQAKYTLLLLNFVFLFLVFSFLASRFSLLVARCSLLVLNIHLGYSQSLMSL